MKREGAAIIFSSEMMEVTRIVGREIDHFPSSSENGLKLIQTEGRRLHEWCHTLRTSK